jgi:hypothetical protein
MTSKLTSRLVRTLALVCALFPAPCALLSQVPTGWVQVTSTNQRDAGVLVANGTVSFQPVNNSVVAISFRAAGGYGAGATAKFGVIIGSQTPGSGYSGSWSCAVNGGTYTSAASCSATVSGGGLVFAITSAGVYTAAPTSITFSGGSYTAGTPASVTPSMTLSSAIVTAGGAGYAVTSATFPGCTGSIASAVTVSGGAVTAVSASGGACPSGTAIVITGQGQAGPDPITCPVTNGAFSCLLPDSVAASPANVCYAVTVTDNASGNALLGPGYTCVQPAGSGAAVTGSQPWCTAGSGGAGGNCNFDLYTPNLAALVVQQTGPPGPASTVAGPPGLPCTWRGSWAATTGYAVGNCYSNGNYNYLVGTAYTSGATFGSTDTANASVYGSIGSGGYAGVSADGYNGLYAAGQLNSARPVVEAPGVVADSTTDNTTALQTQITSGLPLMLPTNCGGSAGNVDLAGPLNYYSGTSPYGTTALPGTLAGNGAGGQACQTSLNFTGTSYTYGAVNMPAPAGAAVSGYTIENLNIGNTNAGGATSGYALWMSQGTGGTINGVLLQNTVITGFATPIYWNGVGNSNVNNVVLKGTASSAGQTLFTMIGNGNNSNHADGLGGSCAASEFSNPGNTTFISYGTSASPTADVGNYFRFSHDLVGCTQIAEQYGGYMYYSFANTEASGGLLYANANSTAIVDVPAQFNVGWYIMPRFTAAGSKAKITLGAVPPINEQPAAWLPPTNNLSTGGYYSAGTYYFGYVAHGSIIGGVATIPIQSGVSPATTAVTFASGSNNQITLNFPANNGSNSYALTGGLTGGAVICDVYRNTSSNFATGSPVIIASGVPCTSYTSLGNETATAQTPPDGNVPLAFQDAAATITQTGGCGAYANSSYPNEGLNYGGMIMDPYGRYFNGCGPPEISSRLWAFPAITAENADSCFKVLIAPGYTGSDAIYCAESVVTGAGTTYRWVNTLADNGTVTYTAAAAINLTGYAAAPRHIAMNCTSACALTLQGQPSPTYCVSVISIGSTLATVTLTGTTYNGGSTAPILSSTGGIDICADSASSTNFIGPLGGGGAGLPSGTRAEPLSNATGGTTYASSPVYLDASQFSGAPATQISSCLSAALAGNFVCDATALSGASAAASSAYTVGNSAGDPTALRLPPYLGMQYNSGSASAILTQEPNTTIIGPQGAGIANKVNVENMSGGTPGYIYDFPGGATGDYGYVDGLGIYSGTGSHVTTSGIGAHFAGACDGSLWAHMPIEDYNDTYGAMIEGVGCGATFFGDQFNSGDTGGIPLGIRDISTTVGKTQGLNMISTTFVHPLPGQPVEQIMDNLYHYTDVHHFGTYIETSNTDLTTTLVQSSGAGALLYDGVTVHCRDANTAAFLSNDGVYNTNISVTGLSFEAGGTNCGAFPHAAVINTYTGHTANTDSLGRLGGYFSAPLWAEAVNAFNLTLNSITGSTQCLHVSSTGVVSGTGADCGGGGGSGTVNSGTAGQIAYYATTGTAISGTNTLPAAVSSNLFNKQMAFLQFFGDSYNLCEGATEQTHTSWCAFLASSVNTNEIAPNRSVGGTTIWQIADSMWQSGYTYHKRPGMFATGDGANDGAHDPNNGSITGEYETNWTSAHNALMATQIIPPDYTCFGSSLSNGGTYNTANTYPINTVVSASSILYYSILPVPINTTPPNATYWTVFQTPNALAGVYTNTATTASIQAQCNADTLSGTWNIDSTLALNNVNGVFSNLVTSGTPTNTTGASASVTKVINDPSGASTQVGIRYIKATTTGGTFGQFTATVDGVSVVDPVSQTTTFSENTTSGTSIYPTNIISLVRVPVTVTPASTHTIVFTTTSGNSSKVVFEGIDLLPPVGTPGVNYILDSGGNSNFVFQAAYDYLHYKDDQSFTGLPIIPVFQQTLYPTVISQGSGYTGTTGTCTISGGTITNGIAAPTCTATVVGGQLVFNLAWAASTDQPIYSVPPTVTMSGTAGTGAAVTLAATPGPGVNQSNSVGGDLSTVPTNLDSQTLISTHPSDAGQVKYFTNLLNQVQTSPWPNILSPGANGMAGGGVSLGPIDFNPVASSAGVNNVSYFFMNGKPTGTTPVGAPITPFCAMWYNAFMGACYRTDTSSNGPWSGSQASFQFTSNFGWTTFGTNSGTWPTSNLTPKVGIYNSNGLTYSLGNRTNLTGTTSITSASLVTTGLGLTTIPTQTTTNTAVWNGKCTINYQQSSNLNTVQFGIGMNANPVGLNVTDLDYTGGTVTPLITSGTTWTTPLAISGTDTVVTSAKTYTNTIDFQLQPTTTTTQTVTIYALTRGGTLTIEPSWCGWSL